MSEAGVYRQTLKARRIAVAMAIGVPLIIVLGMLAIRLIIGPPIGVIGDFVDQLFFLFIVLIPLIFGLAVGYWAVFALKDRIIISDTQIERTGLPHWRIYRGPVLFEKVARVGRASLGVIRIEQVEGKYFDIAPRAYEGSPNEILASLKRRIPANRFEDDLEQRLYQKTGREWRGPALMLIGALIFGLSGCANDLYDEFRTGHAWTAEIEAAEIREDLESFDIGDDGTIWLLVKKPLGDYQDPLSYEVRRISPSGTEVFEFPPFEELYPDGPPEIGRGQPEGIRVTPEGAPRILMFLINPALIWNGNQWEWEAPPTQERGPLPIEMLAAGEHGDFWAQIESSLSAHVTIPSTGSTEIVDLGPEMDDYAVVFEAEPRGWKLAKLRGPDRRSFLLAFKDDPLEGQWLEVESELVPLSESRGLLDYTVGPGGSLYALTSDWEYCENDVVTFFAGRLNPAELESWTWRALQYSQDCDDLHDSRDFLVDARGRIWLEGWNKVAVFDAGVFDTPQTFHAPETVYSEDNSGYFMSHRLRIGPDERLWSLDMTGDALVSIDPDVDDLPAPLPDWFSIVSESLWSSATFWVIGAAIWILGLILTRNDGRLRRSN